VALLGADGEGEALLPGGALDGRAHHREQRSHRRHGIRLLRGRGAAARDHALDHGVEGRRRVGDERAQRLGSALGQEVVLVESGREHRRVYAQLLVQQDLERALHRALARLVAIEEQDHASRAAPQLARVLRRERRPTGGEGALHSAAHEGHEVEVALHDDGALAAADRLERIREPEEALAFAEHGALGSVQVLRLLAFPDGSAAEALDAPAHVANREGHTAAQAIVVAAGASLRDEPRLLRDLGRDSLLAKPLREVLPRIGREADAEALDDLGVDAAARQVGRTGVAGNAQGLAVDGLGEAVRLVDALGHAALARGLLGDLDPDLGGELSHGLGEGEVLHAHQEGDRRSAGVAAEALEALALGVDDEGRGLLGVEGAEPLVIAARRTEAHEATDETNDVRAFANEPNRLVGDQSHANLPPTCSA